MVGLPSAAFTTIYETLPPEAQQFLVTEHLARLLDAVPPNISNLALYAAEILETRFKKIPTLDLRKRRLEVNLLMSELTTYSKLSIVKETDDRDELLAEVVDSLTSWLSDIWSVVYEYHVNFMEAHTCLLAVAEAFAKLYHVFMEFSECKCIILNLPIQVSIRNKKGDIMKEFSVAGPLNVDSILLWIWRDLFVLIFGEGSDRDKKYISTMLEDIEQLWGWGALEKLLSGGRSSSRDAGDGSDEDDDDDDDDDDEEDLYDNSCWEDEPDDEEDSDYRCDCRFHAPYWSDDVNEDRIPLRKLVKERLLKVFESTPSLRLYRALLSISIDKDDMDNNLFLSLSRIAGYSSENLVAALDIHLLNNNFSELASLVTLHSHLLRSRDAFTLQAVVLTLCGTRYRPLALDVLKKQFNDSVLAIFALVRSYFGQIDGTASKVELQEIFKLRVGTEERRGRIESWLDSIVPFSLSLQAHPMSLAAMMMGITVVPSIEQGEDLDILNHIDLDQNDPDLDDFKEQFKPNLCRRFDGWAFVAKNIKDCSHISAEVYLKAIALMPYLRATDVVEEMINRLGDRRSKNHIGEALKTLSEFCVSKHHLLTSLEKKQNERVQLDNSDWSPNSTSA